VSGIVLAAENGTVVRLFPQQPPMRRQRTRSYLTEAEVERLVQAVRKHEG
jgi:hypothetical protein